VLRSDPSTPTRGEAIPSPFQKDIANAERLAKKAEEYAKANSEHSTQVAQAYAQISLAYTEISKARLHEDAVAKRGRYTPS
jgi:hypothetical protein